MLTVLLLLLAAIYEWGPRRHMSLMSGGEWRVTTMDDRMAGGDSVATLTPTGSGMTCALGTHYRWPYCELAFTLDDPEQGIDLSAYQSVILHLEGEVPLAQTDTSWRIYLRNYHPDYSRADDPTSHKVNAIQFDPRHYPGRIAIPLQLFTPTTWWLTDYQIPLMQQGQDLSRVFAVELATGANAIAGAHRLTVKELAFEGPWMSPHLFYRVLFIGWALTVIALLLMDYLAMRRRLLDISHQVSSTMQRNRDLEKKFRMASDQVRYDPLTGAISRHEGEARLSQHKGVISLVFVDIDHFKQINDRFGHPVGDEVLKCLVSELLLHLHEDGTLCRWGGEEFVLLLPGLSQAESGACAERLRLALAAYDHWPHGFMVTASFGVATRLAHEPLSKTLQRADMALYRAKREGRNRVVIAS